MSFCCGSVNRDQNQIETDDVLYPPASSIPPTLTIIFKGNGDIPVAFVINGTAIRPLSDEVWVRIVWSVFESVDATAVLNIWRSEATVHFGCRISAFTTLVKTLAIDRSLVANIQSLIRTTAPKELLLHPYTPGTTIFSAAFPRKLQLSVYHES